MSFLPLHHFLLVILYAISLIREEGMQSKHKTVHLQAPQKLIGVLLYFSISHCKRCFVSHTAFSCLQGA